jgi:hypothetical protein
MPCSEDSTTSKPFRPKGVGLDHVEDQAVAVVARLDAVDLTAEFVAQLGDIGEVLDAGLGGVLRHRQGVLGALQVDAEHLDRAVVPVGGDVAFHGRHPVAEEDVDVAVLQAGVGHRHREHLRLRRVAKAFQHHRSRCRGRRDVGPADVGEAHVLAGRRVGRLGSAHRRHQGQRDHRAADCVASAECRLHVSASSSRFYCRAPFLRASRRSARPRAKATAYRLRRAPR